MGATALLPAPATPLPSEPRSSLAPPPRLLATRPARRADWPPPLPPPFSNRRFAAAATAAAIIRRAEAVRLGPVPAFPRRDVSPWRQSPWARSPLGGDGAGPVPGPAPAARLRRTAPPVWPPRPPPAAGRSRDPFPSPVRG